MNWHPHPISSWRQPAGRWVQRGASADLIRAGLGLDVVSSPSWKTDAEGFGLGHYWAHSPQPEVTFATLSNLSSVKHWSTLSQAGWHPWHFLMLNRKAKALEVWQSRLKPPSLNLAPLGISWAHILAWTGSADYIPFLDILGRHWGDVTLDDEGLCPLTIALHLGDEALLRGMLEHGLDPMLSDAQGRTPMHHAARLGWKTMVALMEDFGGDTQGQDHHGVTPLSLLRLRKHPDNQDRELLRQHWEKRRREKFLF